MNLIHWTRYIIIIKHSRLSQYTTLLNIAYMECGLHIHAIILAS